MKRLDQMTLEELWELFPISLVPHNPEWEVWGKEEIHILEGILKDFSPLISHIGSTAIPRIFAKPTVDILIEIPYSDEWQRIVGLLEQRGYLLMSRGERRMSFNKGYTPYGYADRVFHIHFHEIGDNDEIVFRDYLIKHPDVAHEYERLKLSLLPTYRNDRDGYTEAKTEFVINVVRTAKQKSDFTSFGTNVGFEAGN